MTKDNSSIASPLSEREERLLEAYHDGECNPVGRWRVARLLRRQPQAQHFLNALASTARDVVELRESANGSVQLWDKIEARLAQEEYAARFLGRRERLGSKIPAWDWARPLGWGLSGAAVSAALMALVFMPMGHGGGSTSSRSVVAASPGPESGQLSPIAFSSGGPAAERVSQEEPGMVAEERLRRVPRVMEVDWMRSRGRVRMIQDPGDRAGILWVNRNRKAYTVASPLSVSQNARTPSAPVREPIRMLEEHVPEAFSAYDR